MQWKYVEVVTVSVLGTYFFDNTKNDLTNSNKKIHDHSNNNTLEIKNTNNIDNTDKNILINNNTIHNNEKKKKKWKNIKW